MIESDKAALEICDRVLKVLKENDVISKHSGDIVLSSPLQHLGIEDSLAVLEAIMHIEDEFDISIANPHELCTLSDLVYKIKEELGI